MAAKHTYANTVPNYTGGAKLTLEAGSKDGDIFVALYSKEDASDDQRCLLDPEDARRLIDALEEALRNVSQKR